MKTNDTTHITAQSPEAEEKKLQDWFDEAGGRAYIAQKIAEDSDHLNDETATASVDHPIPSERMKQHLLASIRNDKQKTSRNYWLRIVAILLPFILLSGAMAFLANRSGVFTPSEYAEFHVPYGEQMQVALQDGSRVMLNSGSTLRYPKSFGLFNREVKLSGEGFFSVTKDTGRPFVIDLNGVTIKVTGTEFNVKAYPDESLIYVTLTEGHVYLQDLFNKKYNLVQGETAEYNRNSAACQISSTKNEAEVTAWRSKSLNFYRTPLKEIIKVLERQYDIRFTTTDSTILTNRFTISTGKTHMEEILKDLEKVSRIRFTPTDKGDYAISNTK